jgi:hypothetical protein
MAVTLSDEQFIAHVDTTALHHLRRPILGVLARHHVEHLELRHFIDELLASGAWLSVRAVPHPSDASRSVAPATEFDVYGRARPAAANPLNHARAPESAA